MFRLHTQCTRFISLSSRKWWKIRSLPSFYKHTQTHTQTYSCSFMGRPVCGLSDGVVDVTDMPFCKNPPVLMHTGCFWEKEWNTRRAEESGNTESEREERERASREWTSVLLRLFVLVVSAQGEMSEVRALKATRGVERKEEGEKGWNWILKGKWRRWEGELEE